MITIKSNLMINIWQMIAINQERIVIICKKIANTGTKNVIF